MATSQINISINAQDNASAQVAAVSNNIANLNTTIINISQVLQGLNVTWDMLGEKVKNFATAGIGANAVLESLQTKLTGLISANSAYFTPWHRLEQCQKAPPHQHFVHILLPLSY